MKKHLLLLPLLITFLGITTIVHAASGKETRQEGIPLCPPGILPSSDCRPSGAAQVVNAYAQQGIDLPPAPFPVQKPDPSLTYTNVRYAQVRYRNAPVYGSLEDAIEGDETKAIRKIDAAFSYVSYSKDTVVDGARFYEIAPNNWMTANDVIRVTPPYFQGYLFTQTPDHAFGWVLTYLSPNSYVESKRTPGDAEDYTGHALKNHELVWIYDTVEVNGEEWYLIGPDEWLPQGVIAAVFPNPTPPAGVTAGRWIEVNLFEQTLAVYDNYEL
ncbi:MAG: hypothetical protein D6803_03805, partial [Anaerolineae bacterium]